ncbi:MAG TPA: flippase [Gemmatimonadaceae bacterium]|nr:flippase [Gemmatimonadaceae bacterium]
MINLLRSRTARDSYLNLAGLGVPLIIGLALIPVTMRGLGIPRFGLLSVALTVLEYSTLFALGLGPATTKHVAESIAKKDERASELVIVSGVGHALLGIVGCILIVLLAPFLANVVFEVPADLRDEAVTVFRLIGLMVPATLLLLSLFGALEGASRFGLVNMLRVPVSALSFIVPAVGVTRGYSLPAILVALIVVRLVACGVIAALIPVTIPSYRWRWPRDWSRITPLLSFGAWLSVSNLVSPTLIYADRFMLGALRGLSPVGFYAAPFDAVMRLLMIPASLSRAMFPTVSALQGMSQHERLVPLFRRAVSMVLLLMIGPVAVLILFAPQLLDLWLGSEIAAAAGTATRILAVGLLFNAAALVPSTFLSAIGRPDISAKFHMLELIIHLPLTWWLVTRYGIVGAATAWTSRVILDSILLFGASRGALLRTSSVRIADTPVAAEMI